ncbi:ABC transporter permease [Salinibacterium hongtaonis]|uniref:ABC transporter permease n=1 Tax=Homoserinimonas hongtaonis TaxID=2079791 RepID=UPI000D336200|nr:ABC transporter permease subunit [Salinibacterium hongtaonis]AWB89706.1 ABC transporter permease [Salinibacterium hongtaonis]
MSGGEPMVRRGAVRAVASSLGRSAATALITVAVVIGAWFAIIAVLDISSFLAKTPLDVIDWLFVREDAPENLAKVWGLLLITLADASIGFSVGLLVALIVALAFALSRGLEQALMPMALLLRSIPLVALAPILMLIFGRGITMTAVMGAIVVLFPALVTIAFGLRSASAQIADVITVYGGTRLTVLRTVALPSSMPAFFAAVRISVPAAITGALLAEWLATGQGLGYSITTAVAQVKNFEVWSSVVAVTLASVVLYALAQLVENIVLARMGAAAIGDAHRP